VYNHFNKCNISIYFCNIHIKHLQHTSETLEIYACNMRFHPSSSSLRRCAERGMGRRRVAPSWPLLEASRGVAGTSCWWASQALARRKAPATGVVGCRWAPAGRGTGRRWRRWTMAGGGATRDGVGWRCHREFFLERVQIGVTGQTPVVYHYWKFYIIFWAS
jgi:hypothetical protein